MNRNSVFALVLAAAATAAFAGDITIDTTPFVSTKSRAEVQAQRSQPGPNVWSNQYNPLAQFSAQRSRAEVVAEYLASRDEVTALAGEDSGSAYLVRRRDARAQAVRLAGQPAQAR